MFLHFLQSNGDLKKNVANQATLVLGRCCLRPPALTHSIYMVLQALHARDSYLSNHVIDLVYFSLPTSLLCRALHIESS